MAEANDGRKSSFAGLRKKKKKHLMNKESLDAAEDLDGKMCSLFEAYITYIAEEIYLQHQQRYP
ncbi:hypothetical protein IGI04_005781, partial [Brassica rapa subsp. trilocularis]